MARGEKVLNITDINDLWYYCEYCDQQFKGSDKSIDIRVRLHYKKVHNVNNRKLQWPKGGITIHQDKSKLATNSSTYTDIIPI